MDLPDPHRREPGAVLRGRHLREPRVLRERAREVVAVVALVPLEEDDVGCLRAGRVAIEQPLPERGFVGRPPCSLRSRAHSSSAGAPTRSRVLVDRARNSLAASVSRPFVSASRRARSSRTPSPTAWTPPRKRTWRSYAASADLSSSARSSACAARSAWSASSPPSSSSGFAAR
jgi:hypothetical protein